jgi:hypothetical protein
VSANVTLPEVAALAAQLPPAERRQLAETILRDLASPSDAGPPRAGRRWREIRASVPFGLLGEDAQAWVSRTRRESDERREQALRKPS